jgi:hypothetical protein
MGKSLQQSAICKGGRRPRGIASWITYLRQICIDSAMLGLGGVRIQKRGDAYRHATLRPQELSPVGDSEQASGRAARQSEHVVQAVRQLALPKRKSYQWSRHSAVDGIVTQKSRKRARSVGDSEWAGGGAAGCVGRRCKHSGSPSPDQIRNYAQIKWTHPRDRIQVEPAELHLGERGLLARYSAGWQGTVAGHRRCTPGIPEGQSKGRSS